MTGAGQGWGRSALRPSASFLPEAELGVLPNPPMGLPSRKRC